MTDLPLRKPIRLKGFDYSTDGAYFVTICTHDRKNILSNIVGAIHESPVVKLKPLGCIVDRIIRGLPSRFGIRIDKYVIMPNHIHMIIVVHEDSMVWAIRESPLHSRSLISKVVGYLKMNASKEIHAHGYVETVWQSRYHDHIIRGEQDYREIWQYIENNPLKWSLDKYYCE